MRSILHAAGSADGERGRTRMRETQAPGIRHLHASSIRHLLQDEDEDVDDLDDDFDDEDLDDEDDGDEDD